MNRAEYRQVALARLADARALLQARRYAGAYYLAGYVIECALKARIAQQFQRTDIPDHRLVSSIYTHDLGKLLRLAELEQQFAQAAGQDAQLELYWGTLRTWSETSRYDTRRSRIDAENLLMAITDPDHGVLTWLRQYW